MKQDHATDEVVLLTAKELITGSECISRGLDDIAYALLSIAVLSDETPEPVEQLAQRCELDIDHMRQSQPVVATGNYPGYLTVERDAPGQQHVLYVSGTPEVVVENSVGLLTVEGEEILQDEVRIAILQQLKRLLRQNEQVVAYAYRDITLERQADAQISGDFVLAGFVVLPAATQEKVPDELIMSAGEEDLIEDIPEVTLDPSEFEQVIAAETTTVRPHRFLSLIRLVGFIIIVSGFYWSIIAITNNASKAYTTTLVFTLLSLMLALRSTLGSIVIWHRRSWRIGILTMVVATLLLIGVTLRMYGVGPGSSSQLARLAIMDWVITVCIVFVWQLILVLLSGRKKSRSSGSRRTGRRFKRRA